MGDIRETLRKASIFKNLEDQEISEVLNITTEKRIHKEDFIMHEGDEGSTMYMLLEGEVEVSKALTMKFGGEDIRKAEKILSSLRAQDHVILGEMALIAKEKRSASILAKTDCLLLEIRRDDFMRLIETKAVLGVKVLLNLAELLAARLRHSDENVIRLTTALSIALSR
jgi:CRP/FNR family transcriptional regulator, cyclic AMP receptor protein